MKGRKSEMDEKIKKLEEKKAESKARTDAMELVLDVIIEGAPEETAIDFKISKAYRSVCESTSNLVEETTIECSEDYSLEAKKEVLEYLTMVAEGIKNYTEIVKEELKNKAE